MEKEKSNKAYKTEDLNRHVMILVAGTSDPGNIDDDGTKALSYGTAPTGYWDEKFVKELNEFDKINKNFTPVKNIVSEKREKFRNELLSKILKQSAREARRDL